MHHATGSGESGYDEHGIFGNRGTCTTRNPCTTEGETMTGQRQHIRAEGGRGPCVACGAARGAQGDCVARWVRERIGGPREAVRGYAGRLEVSEGAVRPDGLQ